MNLVSTLGLVLVFSGFTMTTASPQTKMPPAPTASASLSASTAPNIPPSGPTLDETTKLIADQSLAQIPTAYSATITGDWNNSARGEIALKSLAFARCKLDREMTRTLHWPTGDPFVQTESNRDTPLSSYYLGSVEICTESSYLHEDWLNQFQQSERFSLDPELYLVGYSQVGDKQVTDASGQVASSTKIRIWTTLFVSDNKPLAERVANGWIHAIVLCGGGKIQPF